MTGHDWITKLTDGFNLAGHISTLRSNGKHLAQAFKIWAIATVALMGASWAGLWQRLAYRANVMLWQEMPMLQFSFAPVHFSNQVIWFVSMVMLLMIMRNMLGTKTRQKSLWWYFFRTACVAFLTTIFAGIAHVSWLWITRLSARLSLSHLAAGGAMTAKMGAFAGLLVAVVFLVLSLRMMLVSATFGAGLFLQGKALGFVYDRGVKLLNSSWAYLVGPFTYIGIVVYFLHNIMMPQIAIGSSMAVFVGALSGLCNPLYWVLFLHYYKRAVKGK